MHGPFLCLGDGPSQSPTATASSPFCRLAATSSPGRGKSFHSGGGLGKEGNSRPRSSTARRSQLISAKLFALAKASPFRERWHGEAVTERVCFRGNPLSLAALDSSPEGRALGKEDKSRPHSSTAKRSQLVSTKLSASAKASPFRERWHGIAVTERVAFGTNPFRHFALRNATSPEGGGLGKEGEFCPHKSTTRTS